MAKEIQGYIKVVIPAGKATPAPPLGPALGQRKINIMEFCKAFNTLTAKDPPGQPLPTIITVYSDNSFAIKTKGPTTSYLIKQALKIEKGGAEPGRVIAGNLKDTQLTSIAKDKMKDLNTSSLPAAKKIVAGTARSMGLVIK